MRAQAHVGADGEAEGLHPERVPHLPPNRHSVCVCVCVCVYNTTQVEARVPHLRPRSNTVTYMNFVGVSPYRVILAGLGTSGWQGAGAGSPRGGSGSGLTQSRQHPRHHTRYRVFTYLHRLCPGNLLDCTRIISLVLDTTLGTE